MSLIAVQAGVGAHVIRDDPDAAARALDVIAETSRSALDQTRALVGLLREDGERATRPPLRGLDDLDALVDDVGRAGVAVRLVRTGTAYDVDAPVALAAYRVVQESLTNVLKHTTADAASVRVTWSDGALDLEVLDPGPARPVASSAGHGLLGLEERVHLLGGRISSGPDGAGYRVAATLPTGRAA